MERIYFILQLIVSPSREAKADTQGRSWKLEPQWNTNYWLAPRLSFRYLSYISQAHLLRNGTAHNRLALFHRYTHNAIRWRQLLN